MWVIIPLIGETFNIFHLCRHLSNYSNFGRSISVEFQRSGLFVCTWKDTSVNNCLFAFLAAYVGTHAAFHLVEVHILL